MKKAFILASRLTVGLLILLSFNNMISAQIGKNAGNPPTAKKIAKKDVNHGEVRIDNYYWLRQKADPDVIAYLEAENAYTDRVMKPTEGFQENLYKEIVARIKETDVNVPYRLGDYFYYSRTEKGKQYPIYCRKHGSLTAREEVTLDLNELAKGHKFLGLGAYVVSDDANLLAFSTDTTGYRQYTLYVKDLRTGQLLTEQIERVDNVMWATDNKTLFYTTEDQVTKRSDKFFRHLLGSTGSDLVYEEKDELYDVAAHRSRDKEFIFIESESKITSETRYFRADQPNSPLRVFLPREIDHKYFVDHRGDRFYIRTNQGAKNYRLMTVPVSDPDKKNWKELLAHRPKIKLDDIDLFANYLVVSELENGLQHLEVVDLRSNTSHRVEYPEPVYALTGAQNHEFNTSVFRFNYQSLVTPPSVFDYDMDTRKQTLLKQTEVLGGYDKSLYTSERLYATTSDGTRIPISIVYKKGLRRDGKNPLLLYGYGSYGYPISPTFKSALLSLLDRGVVYAIAHIRGGGEMGEEWREQGRMMFKRNTFEDFIASAEYLIHDKYTSSDRLAIEGGSAGGLLMGAVTNMRPDLFKAVVAHVPFVDIVNTMLDASLPLTTGEYLEWGNPNEEKAYRYMRSYSPYDNVGAKEYPAMLVKVSLNDSQVPYWEGAKFVAKLRATKTDDHLVLLKTNMGAGHGGSSGRYDALKELAFDYSFILNELGITN